MAEEIKTVLRKAGKTDAYEQLKEMTSGQAIDAKSIAEFISELKISDEDKQTLMNLTPKKYIGLSAKLVDLI